MTHRKRQLIVILVAALPLCLPEMRGAETSFATNRQPRVLVLYSNERLLPANIAADEAIRTTFESELKAPVEFYTEFLDVDRLPGVDQQERTREFLVDKYRERPPDVIIAGGTSALNFLIRHRATLFPRVPVVHCGVPRNRMPDSLPDDLIVGIPTEVDMMATLKLALRLQPDTRRVAIVSGGNGVRLSEAEIASWGAKVEFLWLTNRSIAELRDELSHLPNRTVVLYGTMFRDPAGNAFTPRAALDRFAPASRAPIYGQHSTYLGHGIVGGSMITYETIGRSAAQTAIRILQGQNPQEAARGMVHTPTPMFDWQQLRRWNISERSLPPGAEIRFRQPSQWEQHKWAIIGGVALVFVETALIAGLILQLRKRRLAEALARVSEKAAIELTGRLIDAQEDERSRIARDLHDDLSQRLALISVELEIFGQKPPAEREAIAGRMQHLSSTLKGVSSEVHRLAHKLHPAKLDQLGLVATARGFCKELAAAHEIAIEFESRDVPRMVPKDGALCLYRILQEALQNVIKHSDATCVKVELAADGQELRLIVTDDGRGFDLQASEADGSLGLVSMRERVRMVQGQITVNSGVGEGTRVEVRVPIIAPGRQVSKLDEKSSLGLREK